MSELSSTYQAHGGCPEAGAHRPCLAAVTLTHVHLTFMKQIGLGQISDKVSIEIAIEAVQR